ncbi:two-component system response regulator [Novimethylophilus kurashikiensis]|uniref:Two-component system response regulator n=1 Tax=Novimethylophilus kurashikiensis TaxID=1825523 RepID=A0A2R5F7U4_9PROT|nr:HDOD domain-containing protein [Novimethylophilus kurashikiensis]GBG12704.1 two-component system response regulator [Novimethylophilus kurashikiensis]
MSDKLDYAELKASGLLPSPRGVALAIMQICQQENFSLQELAHTIQGDPVLAGRVIKIANLANPNKSRPIASVTTDSLILIGIHAVRQVVLSFSLINTYQEGACKNFDYQKFWARSVAMGCAAHAIGSLLRIAPSAEMFTCGLLAGVGRLGLAAVRPQAYSALLSETAGSDINHQQAEEHERFGLSHCELGAQMMADWGFPKLFIDAIVFHENPETSGFVEGTRQYKLAATLQLADLMANICLAREAEREAYLPHMFEVGATLSLSREQIMDLTNLACAEWREWAPLLNIRAEGSTARFTLPEPSDIAEAAMAETEQMAGLQPSNFPLRIVFADDDQTLTLLMSRLLASAGHTVFTAKNGRLAYELAQREKVHVIIADWVMPEADGLMLCQSIRKQDWGRDIYFMILTALEDEQLQIEAFEAGVDAFVKKPFNARLLNAKLLAAQRRFDRQG